MVKLGREENRERQYERALGEEINWIPIDPGQTVKEVKDNLMDFQVKIADNKPPSKVHMRIIQHSKGYELANSAYAEYRENWRALQKKLNDSASGQYCWAPYKPHGPSAESPFYYGPGLCKGVAEWR